jgi:hypothetical protein
MTTAITIAPSALSNVMAVPSQAGAGVKIERRDSKRCRANGDEDKVESEGEHWRSFFVAISRRTDSCVAENAFGRFEYRECRI